MRSSRKSGSAVLEYLIVLATLTSFAVATFLPYPGNPFYTVVQDIYRRAYVVIGLPML